MPEAPSARSDPGSLLPLPHLEYQVLVCLADAPLHGYGIAKEVGLRSPETAQPSTGSLYLAIARLLDAGLIEEVAGEDTGRRKRVYGLTGFGRAVAEAETARLEELAGLAARRLGRRHATAPGGNRSRG